MGKIAILVAMGMEAERLTGRIEGLSTETVAKKKFILGKIGQAEVVLHRCGWGMRNAASGVRALAEHYRPDCIVNYGVSGGMMPDIQLGETVVALSSFPCSGKAYKAGIAVPTDEKLAEFAANLLPHARKAPVCTSQGLIVNIKRKLRIAEQSGAVCCDMETYTAAKTANALGVPLLVIRSISDTLKPSSLLAFFKNGALAADIVGAAAELVIKQLGEEPIP